MGIAASLLAYAIQNFKMKKMTILNVPSDEADTIGALQRLGFEVQLEQFEMGLTL